MVEWVADNITDPEASMIDLGCGNGHVLLELSNEGFKNLMGIDYSESAITLAKSVAERRDLGWIKYEAVDFLTNPDWFVPNYKPFDVVLDKGTYDAISLHPDQVQAKKDGVPGPREKYVESVHRMIDHTKGLFLITSCNWTKEELIENFKNCKYNCKVDTCLEYLSLKRFYICRLYLSLKCQISCVSIWWYVWFQGGYSGILCHQFRKIRNYFQISPQINK